MLRLIVAAFAIIIGAPFQFGYANGVMNSMSGAMKDVFNQTGVTVGSYSWNTAWSLTTGLWCAGGGVGALLGGPAAENLGRKWSLLLNNLFLLLGSVLQVIPLQISGQVYDFVLWGRFINGIGCGVATTVGPMMLTEISPLVYRGIFGTCNQFGVVIGMLLAWIIGLPQLAISSESLDPNAFVLGIPLVFGVLQLLILPWCPDSPAFLVTKNIDDAKKAANFYGLEEPKIASASGTLPFSDPLFYKPMIVAAVMMLSQQLSGINAIFFYSTDLFKEAGVEDGPLSTVYVGVVNIVFTFFSLLLIDKFGRKPLHMIGLSGMLLMALALGTVLGFYLNANETVSVLSVVFVLIFVAFFQCGPGSIPWFISAELFTDQDRPRAMAIAAGINWAANAAVGFSYPLLNKEIGGATFFIFAGLLVVFIAFTHFKVPETKNKSVIVIQKYFDPNHHYHDELSSATSL